MTNENDIAADTLVCAFCGKPLVKAGVKGNATFGLENNTYCCVQCANSAYVRAISARVKAIAHSKHNAPVNTGAATNANDGVNTNPTSGLFGG